MLTAIVVDHRPIDLSELAELPPSVVGQEAAVSFESFYVANERRLFRALFVVTGDRHEAEDLMQTAFCKVLERWDRVADPRRSSRLLVPHGVQHASQRRAADHASGSAGRSLVERSAGSPGAGRGGGDA